MWTDRATPRGAGGRPVDDGRPPGGGGETAGMSVEVPVLEVLGLADRLRAAADLGAAAAARLPPPGDAGAVTAALEEFLTCFALAARALGGEAASLGDAAGTAARSWLALDEGLLVRRGQLTAR